jgi:hypothetical protein
MASVMVVPRSGCSITSPKIPMATGTTGTSRWRHWSSIVRLVISTCAPQSVKASLAISEGCTDSGPSRSHCCPPLILAPAGLSTTTSSRTDTTRNSPLVPRSSRTGIRSPIQNNTSPTPQYASCWMNTA